jgi:drug/metabolite transporter (DMT)-like permease
MLVPLVSGVTAWLLLGEQFSLLKLLGAGVVLGGLLLARYGAMHLRPRRAALISASIQPANEQA